MIEQLTEISGFGVMPEAFVVEAIRFYCNAVLATDEPKDNPSAIINPRSWYFTAYHMKAELEKIMEENK